MKKVEKFRLFFDTQNMGMLYDTIKVFCHQKCGLRCIKMYRLKEFVDDKSRFKFNNQHFLKKRRFNQIYSDIPEALNNYNFHMNWFQPQIKTNITIYLY